MALTFIDAAQLLVAPALAVALPPAPPALSRIRPRCMATIVIAVTWVAVLGGVGAPAARPAPPLALSATPPWPPCAVEVMLILQIAWILLAVVALPPALAADACR